ncbi:hypothetical protein [Methylorubrum zatmanii]|uniref:Uncharacterized protein n=1 Tax=Methylorubrum zatmanii TaxID=29429 RepID=A0ABW1WNX5_9HYPH|nr:hypothetical protein [Methylorubrum zatmanii]
MIALALLAIASANIALVVYLADTLTPETSSTHGAREAAEARYAYGAKFAA